LVADDEQIILNGLCSLDWRSIGVSVVGSVDNGLEAIEIIQSEMVDIILTDIRMSGLDGIAIAKFVCEHEIGTGVILLSGYSDFNYAREGIRYNVMEYLLKPSDPKEIFAAVQRVGGQIEKRRNTDRRLKYLEAELGKQQLVRNKDDIILGEIEHSETAKRILNYIAHNYKKPISLSSLSSEIYYSSIYLSKVIKKTTGYTFLDIVNGMRIYEAAEQLSANSDKLSVIAENAAIADERYFSQVFKKYYGKTPSAYKKDPCMPLDIKLFSLLKSIQGNTQ
jgi:two-component system response regulator YesN